MYRVEQTEGRSTPGQVVVMFTIVNMVPHFSITGHLTTVTIHYIMVCDGKREHVLSKQMLILIHSVITETVSNKPHL